MEIQNKTNCAENVQLLTQRLNQKRYRVASLSISQRSCAANSDSQKRDAGKTDRQMVSMPLVRPNSSVFPQPGSRFRTIRFSPRLLRSRHIRPRIGAQKKRNSKEGRIDGIDGRFYYRSFDRWRLTGRENNSACLHVGTPGTREQQYNEESSRPFLFQGIRSFFPTSASKLRVERDTIAGNTPLVSR